MSHYKSNTLLWKVLKSNISTSQIVGYALALLAGLTVVMLAAALYADGLRLTGSEGNERLLPDNLLVLSKKERLSPMSFLGAPSGFTAGEISELAEEPWVERCAPFETSRFDATVSVEFGASRFSTALFFESVPNKFFEQIPAGWGFNPASPEVSIILPADYLALYNFGFAPARGLPRLSEGMLSKIPLRVTISGPDGIVALPGRIVGFSRRLNTIAVPSEFLHWANERYGTSESGAAARVIALTKGGSDKEAEAYFSRHNIEATGGSESAGRMAAVLNGFTAVVATVGLSICLLALFIMTLSLRLLVQKNANQICDLHLLGFPEATIVRQYRKLVLWVNLAVFAISTVLLAVSSGMWRTVMTDLGITPAPLYTAIAAGICVAIILTAVSLYSIGKMVRKIHSADRQA